MEIPANIRVSKLAANLFVPPILNAIEAGIAPTAALAVFHEDVLVFEGGWGWIDPEDKQIVATADTWFDLASLTKLFTMTAFLSLVSEGKVDVHTSVADLVPEFAALTSREIAGGQNPQTKEAEPVDPRFAGQVVRAKQITCWHLLTHTSGLPAWRDVYAIADPPPPPTDSDPLAQVERWQRALRQICTYPFVAPPDTGVRYSDIGLMLLGEVVARLHGTPGDLETALRERVTDAARFRPTFNDIARILIAPTEVDSTWRKRRVWGEVHDENACGVGGVAGHAGLFSTAAAVAAFGSDWLHYAEGRFGIKPDIAADAVREQISDNGTRRGLGWAIKAAQDSSAGDLFSPNSYGHTGFTGTSLWIDPERDLVVALLTNRVYPGREVEGIHALRRTVHDGIVRAISG